MNLVDLPNDIFLLIVDQLSPTDLILSRRVSRRFKAVFTEPDLCRHLLIQHFPRVRELKTVDSHNGIDWAGAFEIVTSRYHHLKSGHPRSVEQHALAKSMVVPKWSRSYPVAPWHRHLHFEEKSAPFHYYDSLWTYDDGIMIFPSAEFQQYVLYDIAARHIFEVDIEAEKRIVRRIRLKEKVLIIEWCEDEAYHQLNETETVFRHFATAYDIVQEPLCGKWELSFRNEWKIHFLGMPLNSRDRFFSTHNANHYVLYLWQPNRSAWGEDDPIESLAIWDISSPSSYKPCGDPTGKAKPDDSLEGPKVIRRLSFADLDFYRIRQRSTPVLQRLEIDENHVYVIEENHRWIVGQQASYLLPRLHHVKSVGIPFAAGPRWEDECGADGDINLSFCERISDTRHPKLAPCWRHEEFPYLTITEAVDSEAGVIFSARHCFRLETISISLKPKVQMVQPAYEIALRDDLWQQLLAKGKICGDERWLIGENLGQEIVILHFDKQEPKIHT